MSTFVTFKNLGYYGEFGNQMFQIAAVIGYARKHSKIPIFPKWTCKISGRDYTNVFEHGIDSSFDGNGIEKNINWMELKYVELPYTDGNVDLCGYFQSEKYFLHCEQEIRSIFTPSSYIRNYIEDKYSSIINEPEKVSLHIRTGKRASNDYDVHQYTTSEFLTRAVEHYGDKLYVVFADNMEEAKKILPHDKRYCFIENENNYIDLLLMTYFDAYIVSPSTFGWWGAWLSKNKNPEVVIQKTWFNVNKEKSYLNDNDIIPERWTIK